MNPAKNTSVGIVIAGIIWLALVGAATALMVRYSNTPGSMGAPPSSWPNESRIPFDLKQPTLIMFAHPHCPCTRASLSELARLLARVPDKLNTYVVFLKPDGTPSDWDKTDLWRTASAIPGVTTLSDNTGAEAHRFHAETSGQTLLYNQKGTLLFNGGVTLARGHEGDNPGRTALEDIILRGHSAQTNTPVFGCGLFEMQCEKGTVVCKP
jgi:hypothetical protein